MTAKESKTNNKVFSFKYFSHSLRSYWWLGVIAAIAYGIAGPLILWMGLASMSDSKMDVLQIRYAQSVNEWFHLMGVLSYYIIAMFLAVVFALVIWSYLHSKKQVNFYHSMPISRTALFVNNTLVGIVINFIPLLIMYGLMILVGISYAGTSALPWSWILVHILRIFLFFMLSYSLAILAAHLTGTVLTQLGMSAILHFGLMSFLTVGILAMQTFLNTFSGNVAFDRVWALSPLTNVIYWASSEQSTYVDGMYHSLDGLGVKWILEIVAITVIAFALAFIAYRKRHSESAGQSLLFGFTKPIVEFILMFCIATLAAIAFLEVSGKFFFLVGLVLFAVLTHMFCQVIFNKDFKAMFADKKYLIGFLVILLLFFGGLYGDVFGYDKYVPASDKVSAIQIDLSELDGWSQNRNNYEESNIYTDANDIELLLSIANQLTEKGYYWRNSNLYNNDYQDEFDDSKLVSLQYTYITASGREISRYYGSVPLEAFKQDFAALYNRDSFKQVNYDWLLNAKAKDLNYYSIDTWVNTYYSDEQANGKIYNYSQWQQGYLDIPYGEELLNALKQDVMNRKAVDVAQAPIYRVNLEFINSDTATRFSSNWKSYYDLPIYPSDVNTIAFLAELEKEGLFSTVDYDYLANYIKELDVYEVDMSIVGNIESLVYGGYRYNDAVANLSEAGLVKTKTITDKKEIARILALGVDENQYNNISPFASFRDDVFIGVKCTNYSESDTWWDMGLLLPDGAEI